MTQQSQTAVKLALPRQFREIRFELAREPGHPAGSRQHGYRLIAPLDAEAHIDADCGNSIVMRVASSGSALMRKMKSATLCTVEATGRSTTTSKA